MDGLKEKVRREIGLKSLALGVSQCPPWLPLTSCFPESFVPQRCDRFLHADCKTKRKIVRKKEFQHICILIAIRFKLTLCTMLILLMLIQILFQNCNMHSFLFSQLFSMTSYIPIMLLCHPLFHMNAHEWLFPSALHLLCLQPLSHSVYMTQHK